MERGERERIGWISLLRAGRRVEDCGLEEARELARGEGLGRGDRLTQVCLAVLSLVGAIGVVVTNESGAREEEVCDLHRGEHRDSSPELGHEVGEGCGGVAPLGRPLAALPVGAQRGRVVVAIRLRFGLDPLKCLGADAAGWGADRPAEGGAVARVGEQAQVGDEVADLGPGPERDAAENAVRDTALGERLLENAGLRVRPNKDRHFRPADPARARSVG